MNDDTKILSVRVVSELAAEIAARAEGERSENKAT